MVLLYNSQKQYVMSLLVNTIQKTDSYNQRY